MADKDWNWMKGSPLGSLARTKDTPIERTHAVDEQRRNLLSDHRSGYITVSELQDGLKALKDG